MTSPDDRPQPNQNSATSAPPGEHTAQIPSKPRHRPTMSSAGYGPIQFLKNLWHSSSLRTQLSVITTFLMLFTVLITAVLTSSLFRQELVRGIDEDIYANRNNVSLYLTSIDPGAHYVTDFQQSIVRFYGESWTNDGTVVTSILSEGNDIPDINGLTAEEVRERAGQPFTVPGRQNPFQTWRVQVYRLESEAGSVAIALPLSPVNDSVERVTVLVVTIGLLATLVANMVSYLATTRAFRPLNRVGRTAAKIAAGDLSQRVTLGPPDTEVGRLSRSLNAMLAQIEVAFRDKEASEESMRRFVQDASHELRTPLVTIRGYSELYRIGALKTEDDTATAMQRIESEATRMSHLVEDLLTLARLDEQRIENTGPVDLLIIATDIVMDTRVSSPDREISLVGLDSAVPASAPTLGDEDRLRQVVTNLVSNALRYTPDGSPIEIAVGTVDVLKGLPLEPGEQQKGEDGQSVAAAPSADIESQAKDAVIEVRDHGPGISDEDAQRIFERFYRADSSRHRETGGTGLGLAIVAGIVSQHDGSVRLEETPGGGATMVVRLPWHRPEDTEEEEPYAVTGSLPTVPAPEAEDADEDVSAEAAQKPQRKLTALNWTKDLPRFTRNKDKPKDSKKSKPSEDDNDG